ncbi:MAG: hypothetical protein F7C34_02050 [Desulfurococcales archaeon]|nr:hypothetical protein [Desulfurococcales archaeon]
MTTAREAFEAKKLAQKYGIIGKVAARYREAGYDVKVENTSPDAPYHFTASKKGEKLLVKVYGRSGEVPASEVEALASAGQAKKVLVLYGAGPKVSSALLEKAKELGVSIRRVRI